MSYIANNNAEVLMIQTDRHTPFAQRRVANDNGPVTLSPEFNDVSRNNGRVPEMAKAFSVSAKKSGLDWSPLASIEKFETALQKHGNSVFALTDGEAEHLVKDIDGRLYPGVSFPQLLEKLEKTAKPVKAKTPVMAAAR